MLKVQNVSTLSAEQARNKFENYQVSLNVLKDKLHFSFSIPTPGFPHFYYMLGANLGLLLYGEVSVMLCNCLLFEGLKDD